MARPPPTPLFTLKGLMEPVHSIMFDLNKDEEFLYAGTQEGKVHIWDLKNNREITSHKIGDETCLALHKIHSSDENRILLTQEKNGCYKFWIENKIGEKLLFKRVIKLEYFGFCKSIIDYKNKFIICPDNNSIIKLISFDDNVDNEILFKVNSSENIGEIMVIKQFIHFVLVLYESGFIKIWSLLCNECVNTTKLLSDCPMALDLKFYPNHNSKLFGYVGSNTDKILEFDLVLRNETSDISVVKKREVKLTNPGVSFIAIRPDCKLFVTACWDKFIRLFSCKSLKLLVVLDFHKEITQEILFSYNKVQSWSCDYLLVCCSLDRRISLWNLY
ncbi:guanine nucleotide-binding protein subunit beta-like protein 1 [Lycorma delicatula]|uniref:guanine nucleotide-binding protein subunit beta-like protein 1 n=1 Tax=Lycorma delicatula TaxID=130591 RepID=UPI003F512C5F